MWETTRRNAILITSDRPYHLDSCCPAETGKSGAGTQAHHAASRKPSVGSRNGSRFHSGVEAYFCMEPHRSSEGSCLNKLTSRDCRVCRSSHSSQSPSLTAPKPTPRHPQLHLWRPAHMPLPSGESLVKECTGKRRSTSTRA